MKWFSTRTRRRSGSQCSLSPAQRASRVASQTEVAIVAGLFFAAVFRVGLSLLELSVVGSVALACLIPVVLFITLLLRPC